MLRRFILPHRAPRAHRTAVSPVAPSPVSPVAYAPRPPRRTVARAAVWTTALLASAISLGALGAACGTTATTSLLPTITGVIVRADSLVAGRGCGVADTQVFAYAVTLDVLDVINVAEGGAGGTVSLPIAGGSFPCYADGTFANMPPQVSYAVHVVAFNRQAWDAAGGKPVIDAASLPVDGGRPPIEALNALHPTWATECTATPQANIEVLADCLPLSSSSSAPDAGTSETGAPDADTSETGASDAGTSDTGAFDAGASDTGASDAGLDGD